MKSKKIKIKEAKEISEEYGYEKVIIIGINELYDDVDLAIATYGKDIEQCKTAKILGQEVCKDAILNWLWE